MERTFPLITKQWLFAVYHLFTNNKSFPFLYSYVNNTEDIKHLTADGIELTNGKSLEAEIKLVLPDWQPHSFMKDLPIVDEEGFVITDLTMRNPDYPQIFAVGDAAAFRCTCCNSISPLPTGKTFDKLYKCHFGCKGGFRAWLMFVRYAPKE